MSAERLWAAIASRDLRTLANLINDREKVPMERVVEVRAKVLIDDRPVNGKTPEESMEQVTEWLEDGTRAALEKQLRVLRVIKVTAE